MQHILYTVKQSYSKLLGKLVLSAPEECAVYQALVSTSFMSIDPELFRVQSLDSSRGQWIRGQALSSDDPSAGLLIRVNLLIRFFCKSCLRRLLGVKVDMFLDTFI